MGWSLGRIGTAVATGGLSELAQGGANSVIGQISGASSAQAANDTNVMLAREGTAFSAQQAQKQMDFQERMSNTSHQREVQDLRAAGLNPLLSANAGASTPGGAAGSPSVATVNPVPTTLQGVVSTAKDALAAYSTIKGVQNDTIRAKSTAALAEQQSPNIQADTALKQRALSEKTFEANLFEFLNRLITPLKTFSAKDYKERNFGNWNRGGFGDWSNPFGSYMTDQQQRGQ